MIDLARIYDGGPPTGGHAFLVERLWPRGLRRDQVHMDAWFEDVAPSTELRKWFGHDPEKWTEFRRGYFLELDSRPGAWQPLARPDRVILLYSLRDRERNNAVALRDYMRGKTGQIP